MSATNRGGTSDPKYYDPATGKATDAARQFNGGIACRYTSPPSAVMPLGAGRFLVAERHAGPNDAAKLETLTAASELARLERELDEERRVSRVLAERLARQMFRGLLASNSALTVDAMIAEAREVGR